MNDAAPTGSSASTGSSAELDKLSVERFQKLVAMETAEAAKKSVVDWAKWMLAPFAALAVVLGLSTYANISDKIDKMSTKAASEFEAKAKASLEGIAKEIEATRKKAHDLNVEIDAHRTTVAELVEKAKNDIRTAIPAFISTNTKTKASRKAYDAKKSMNLPGTLVRAEGQPPVGDEAIDKTYENLGIFYNFFMDVLGRDSYDGKGGSLVATLNFGEKLNNTFWDGQRLAIGNGDGEMFTSFVNLKIMSGELTHGVTETTAGLVYHGQSGALNTHISDVFAILIEQWHLGQTTDQSNWLIGDGVVGPTFNGGALRSLKAPGTAYDSPISGKDPQPKHMSKFDRSDRDNGGVHINSGIPNHAFYLAATKIGGFGWEGAGRIWYQTLLNIRANTDFAQFAKETLVRAERLFGNNSKQATAVKEAWQAVGIEVKARAAASRPKASR
jgi:Zn-dependent metalloprotease